MRTIIRRLRPPSAEDTRPSFPCTFRLPSSNPHTGISTVGEMSNLKIHCELLFPVGKKEMALFPSSESTTTRYRATIPMTFSRFGMSGRGDHGHQ